MTDTSDTAGKVRAVLLWIVTLAMTAMLGFAGLAKFTMAEMWTGLFVGWSYPAWLSFVVGAFEVVGALLLLVPRFASYAAATLIVIMICAAATVLANPGEMVVMPSLVNIAGLSIVAWARRAERWIPS